MFRDPRLSRMAAFLGSIGIEMRADSIDEPNALLRGVKPFPHMVKWVRGDAS